ncbi:acyl-CoA carboxylase subunit beta [Nonomuraea sp. NBC_01738]|uniref:acyl-CoA carboxylase subunit beta n=1 Tax=Nonomuraea sp. NBC_01738 TaxID=2976003 RepID=UPI003FA3C2C2|nr:acyl-CoA carboxylase subunit beta [Nonomuraea sp. NBC_01738]
MTVLSTMPVPLIDERELDFRNPFVRLAQLLDPEATELLHEYDDSGVVAVRGTIHGQDVIAFCTDATRRGGAIGGTGARHMVDAIDTARINGWPVIGVWHSGGAVLAEGVESMNGVGEMFAAITRASGKVPQISVVLGPAAGAAAYGPALTDLVIMAESGRVFVTGPDVVRSVTGEDIDMAGLGGPEAHGRKSGVVHMIVKTENDAYERARTLIDLFTRQGMIDPAGAPDRTDLKSLLPESSRRAYDVKPVIKEILDGEFVEIQARWAPNVVVGLGRFAGRTLGVVANNPLRKGGCLDSISAEKASRFVRMCDAFGIPLLVMVDVPGYLPGVGQEWSGVVRRGAKLLHAFAEAVVPRVTLVTRKAYGGAYIAMNSRSLGATKVFAWPGAEVAVMGSEAAVGIVHRKKLAAAPEHEREALKTRLIAEHEADSGGVSKAMAMGFVDEVIDPARTRSRLAEVFAEAPCRRGDHRNIPL